MHFQLPDCILIAEGVKLHRQRLFSLHYIEPCTWALFFVFSTCNVLFVRNGVGWSGTTKPFSRDAVSLINLKTSVMMSLGDEENARTNVCYISENY